MKIYFNTNHNTQLTLEDDNIHYFCEALTDIKQFVNADSYIRLNNFLNHDCEECIGSVRVSETTLLYVLEGVYEDNQQRYYLLASESSYGVKLKVVTASMKLMYDRYSEKLC